eukprot:TRINITY_DN5325_c0_g1_i1.p1 TRINITY_DN5325_c0_g1~~TRINITY_DN5325_c0_g1_i1.p1  ORF type:complete len:108 (+),score=18.63 TRINITY_DN5325_c0_g1_i1:211-534(+)
MYPFSSGMEASIFQQIKFSEENEQNWERFQILLNDFFWLFNVAIQKTPTAEQIAQFEVNSKAFIVSMANEISPNSLADYEHILLKHTVPLFEGAQNSLDLFNTIMGT